MVIAPSPLIACAAFTRQVHEHLIDLVRVAVDLRNIAVFLDDLDAVFQLVVDQRQRAFEAFVQVGHLLLRLVQAREVTQTSRQ